MNKMFKYFQSIFYYIMVLIGLIMTSWIIYTRFIRERIIRNIPDDFFTEYRFWVLLYLCCIYVYAIKELIKTSKSSVYNENLMYFSNIFYKPLIMLDHLIKYNKFIKPFYYKFSFIFAYYANKLLFTYLKLFIFCMEILPRIILVIFLILDTFYFGRLELFYKVILIGLLPFFSNYLKYSIKDIYEHWILLLENSYSKIIIFEKGYEFDDERINNTDAFLHYKKVSIREYIEIKHENTIKYIGELIAYEYKGYPFIKEDVLEKYLLNKYKIADKNPTSEDMDYLEKSYVELIPKILDIKLYYFGNLNIINEEILIKGFKVLIFSIYLFCWAYVLLIDRKSTRLNSSHSGESRMPSSA